MKTRSYRILITEEPEDGYTVTVPVLPGCVTYADIISDAKSMAKEAIELYIECLIDEGEPVPTEENTFETMILLEQNV